VQLSQVAAQIFRECSPDDILPGRPPHDHILEVTKPCLQLSVELTETTSFRGSEKTVHREEKSLPSPKVEDATDRACSSAIPSSYDGAYGFPEGRFCFLLLRGHSLGTCSPTHPNILAGRLIKSRGPWSWCATFGSNSTIPD